MKAHKGLFCVARPGDARTVRTDDLMRLFDIVRLSREPHAHAPRRRSSVSARVAGAGGHETAGHITGDRADLVSACRAQPCDGLARRQGNLFLSPPEGAERAHFRDRYHRITCSSPGPRCLPMMGEPVLAVAAQSIHALSSPGW